LTAKRLDENVVWQMLHQCAEPAAFPVSRLMTLEGPVLWNVLVWLDPKLGRTSSDYQPTFK